MLSLLAKRLTFWVELERESDGFLLEDIRLFAKLLVFVASDLKWLNCDILSKFVEKMDGFHFYRQSFTLPIDSSPITYSESIDFFLLSSHNSSLSYKESNVLLSSSSILFRMLWRATLVGRWISSSVESNFAYDGVDFVFLSVIISLKSLILRESIHQR